jgi:hypothetical protein
MKKGTIINKLKTAGFGFIDSSEDRKGKLVDIYECDVPINVEFEEWEKKNVYRRVDRISIHDNTKMSFYSGTKYLGKGFYDDMEDFKVNTVTKKHRKTERHGNTNVSRRRTYYNEDKLLDNDENDDTNYWKI